MNFAENQLFAVEFMLCPWACRSFVQDFRGDGLAHLPRVRLDEGDERRHTDKGCARKQGKNKKKAEQTGHEVSGRGGGESQYPFDLRS